jgi:hypothetical protein
MQRTLRPWTTAGIAIVGGSLIAVTPVAPPPPDVQHRAVTLTDYEEFDASQLASATEANWSGLETVLGSSNWLTDPDISQGLSTLFTDLSSGTSDQPDFAAGRGRAPAHQQRRRVQRSVRRVDGRLG